MNNSADDDIERGKARAAQPAAWIRPAPDERRQTNRVGRNASSAW